MSECSGFASSTSVVRRKTSHNIANLCAQLHNFTQSPHTLSPNSFILADNSKPIVPSLHAQHRPIFLSPFPLPTAVLFPASALRWADAWTVWRNTPRRNARTTRRLLSSFRESQSRNLLRVVHVVVLLPRSKHLLRQERRRSRVTTAARTPSSHVIRSCYPAAHTTHTTSAQPLRVVNDDGHRG